MMRSFTWNRFPIKNLWSSSDSILIRCKDQWCVVLREIDFLLKFVIDSLLISPVEWRYLNTEMRKFESSQKDQSRVQSADFSKSVQKTL